MIPVAGAPEGGRINAPSHGNRYGDVGGRGARRFDHALHSAEGFRSTNAGVRMRIRFGSALGPVLPRDGSAGPDPSNDRGDKK